MLSDSRSVRRLATSAAAALVAALLPAGFASASHIQTHETTDACADAPEDGFVDTGVEGSAQEEAVDCIAWYGVTEGTTSTTYSPVASIKRMQMATMVADTMRESETDFAEPGPSEDHFEDDDGSNHEQNIDFVAKHEVVEGLNANQYGPTQPVTRAQMASFLVNLLRAVGAELPQPSQDHFTDDEDSVHEGNIDILAELGIATGRTHEDYEPGMSVTRGQMALFISRTLDELVDQGLMTPPDQRDQVNVTIADASVEAGDAVTGEITSSGSDVVSATVSGCGLSSEPVEDRDSTEAGIQFSETIPDEQEPGSCTLTFSVELENGSDETVSAQITIEESGPATVTLDQRSVPQGGALTGEVTSDEEDIEAVTVSGCGFANERFEDRDSGDDGVQFRETVPQNQAVGDCTLTFTIRFDNDQTQTTRRTITVTAQPTVSALPELEAVSVVNANASPVQVRYDFDEPVQVADHTKFRLYTVEASQRGALSASQDPNDSSAVLASFRVADFQRATTAAVANGAVTDGSNANPEDSKPLKTVTEGSGATAAPDFVRVGAFTESASTPTATNVEFIFDEEVEDILKEDGFHLILGNLDAMTSIDARRKTGDAKTVIATFDDGSDTPSETQVQSRRAYVEDGTVDDDDDPDPHRNPMQAVAVNAGGRTATPDLVDFTLDLENDKVVYTFDEPVDPYTTGTGPTEQPADPNRFRVYFSDSSEEGATDVEDGPDSHSVTATFGDTDLTTAVAGVSVGAAAVRRAGTSGSPSSNPEQFNRVDEMGTATTPAGTTLAPDLASVRRRTSAGRYPQSQKVEIIFAFDQPVSDVTNGRFVVYGEDGSREVLLDGDPAGDPFESGCRQDGTDPNNVICTVNSQERSDEYNAAVDAVLGAVMHDAVEDQTSTWMNYESSDPIGNI